MAEEKEEKKEEGKKKKSPMLLIIIIVAVLAIGGALAFFLMGDKGEEEVAKETPQEQIEDEETKLETYEFETFTVNLGKPSNYLQTTIQVEYDPSLYNKPNEEGNEVEGAGNKVGEIEKIFEKRNAMIRDAIISILSYKTPEEVLSQEGKEELKEELVDAINNALGIDDAIVVSVYFKDFVMQ